MHHHGRVVFNVYRETPELCKLQRLINNQSRGIWGWARTPAAWFTSLGARITMSSQAPVVWSRLARETELFIRGKLIFLEQCLLPFSESTIPHPYCSEGLFLFFSPHQSVSSHQSSWKHRAVFQYHSQHVDFSHREMDRAFNYHK